MNIYQENRNEGNAIIKIQIAKSDYESKVKETLKEYRKKMSMNGFRPGHVPTGLINKMYGKAVLTEEINKLVNDSLTKYVKDEQITLLGNPLPIENEELIIDFDEQTDYEFAYEIGIAPKVEVQINQETEFPYYEVAMEEKLVDNTIENYRNRFGKYEKNEVSAPDAYLKGDFLQMNEDGSFKDDGFLANDAFLFVRSTQEGKWKEIFAQTKVGEIHFFKLSEVIKTPNEAAMLLRLPNDEGNEFFNAYFRFTITEINTFCKAELNKEFFLAVYGSENIETEEHFREQVKLQVRRELLSLADQRFLYDVKRELLKTYEPQLPLPEEFLKRWLFTIQPDNPNESDEELQNRIDREFPMFIYDLKWQLVRDQISRNNNIVVTEEEMVESAMYDTYMQSQQYGLPEMPYEKLRNIAQQALKNEENRNRIFDQKMDLKVLRYLKGAVKLNSQEITLDELNEKYRSEQINFAS